MSSRKKRQADPPEWAEDVKPKDDVMAMFYAPTGLPKPGPIGGPASSTADPDGGDAAQTTDLETGAQVETNISQPIDQVSEDVQAQLSVESETADLASVKSVQRRTRVPSDGQKVGNKQGVGTESLYSPAARSSQTGPDEGASRYTISAASSLLTFDEYIREWKPFLPQRHIAVLRAIFDMTLGIGQETCFTSTNRIAKASGVSVRHVHEVVIKLERHGFLARLEVYNQRDKKGSTIELYRTRKTGEVNIQRKYFMEGS